LEKVETVERPIVVSDMVYAEISIGIETIEEVDAALARFDFVRWRHTDECLFRAGKAFLAQIRNGGRERLLPDFLIGALADAEGEPLLTRDPQKVRTYFPNVRLITPE
jgi:predicted nucleic acid-binding protein